jgi:hypothetical protein
LQKIHERLSKYKSVREPEKNNTYGVFRTIFCLVDHFHVLAWHHVCLHLPAVKTLNPRDGCWSRRGCALELFRAKMQISPSGRNACLPRYFQAAIHHQEAAPLRHSLAILAV